MRPTTADRSSAESVPAASRFAQATRRLRSLRDDLVALNTVRTASARIVRHSLTWRMRAALVALEQERADQLDLLAGSGVMLARTAMATSDQERPSLAPAIRHLATALAEISRNPGGRATRQRAADRALDLASWLIAAWHRRTGAVRVGCRWRRRSDDHDRRHDLRRNGTGASTPRCTSGLGPRTTEECVISVTKGR
jgi:hypothetical protein